MGLSRTCGILTAVSCGMTFVAAVCHAVAFGTRRWIVSFENSPFVSIGFHEACFDDCRDPYCPASGDINVMYQGCTWFWNWYFQEIWNWLLPSWFMTCRNLCIVNVPLIFIIFIILAICTSLAFKGRYTTETNTERVATAVQVLLFMCAFMLLACCVMLMYLMTTIYTHGFQRSWMPMPEKNKFGWSFWLEFTVTLLLIGAFFLCVAGGIMKTMWLHGDKDPRYSEDMQLGRPSPSPSASASASGALALGAAMRGAAHKTV